MSVKTFRAKARDLEQVWRKYNSAPACGGDDEQPDGEEIPEDDDEPREDEVRDPDPAGDEPLRTQAGLRPPIRLVIRPRPARSRAA